MNIWSIDLLLQRKIGFFYLTQEWKNKIYEYLINRLDPESIAHKYNGRYESYIHFKNGDSITFVPATPAARGYKFTIAGYEEGISQEGLDMVVMSTFWFHNREISLEEFE